MNKKIILGVLLIIVTLIIMMVIGHLSIKKQILSSFKPLSSALTSTTTIYRNQQYGFEIKYPKEFKVKEGFDKTCGCEYTTFSPENSDIYGEISINYNAPNWGDWAQFGETKKETLLSRINIISKAFASPPPITRLENIKIGEETARHSVMKFGNEGEFHTIWFSKQKIKFELLAKWGSTSDMGNTPGQEKHDFIRDQKIIMNAYNQAIQSFTFLH